MIVRVSCPHPDCGQTYRVAESRTGEKTVCKRCGREFAVGDGPGETRQPSGDAETLIPSSRRESRAEAASETGGGLKELGRFQIRGRLGAGAFGTVYRAFDPVLQREVALKVPRGGVLDHPEAKARFLREPKAAAQLNHPNIVPVYDAGSVKGQYYIASACIEGGTLQKFIAENRLDLSTAVQTVRDLAEALSYAHSLGVVHRDVKPANIMIDSKGQALLMDFGLARMRETEGRLTHDGTVMGTPAYMAPEQADEAFGEVGPASDQYSLGVVLYHLLSGDVPFHGPPQVVIFNLLNLNPDSPRKRNHSLPKDLETICLKAMQKRPLDRYRDCHEFAEDLRRWLADEPVLARRQGVVERVGRWARRSPVLAILAATAIVLAVGSSTATLALYRSSGDLADAVQAAREQTEIAGGQAAEAANQATIAKEQSRLAVELERQARDHEQQANEALAKTEKEIKAQERAETDRHAEQQRTARLADELRKGEGEIEMSVTEAKDAENQAQDAEHEARLAVESNSWLKYIKHLSAADEAYQNKNFGQAVKSLQACPEEQRAWEWHSLLALCQHTLRPLEQTIALERPTKPVFGTALFASPDCAWFAAVPCKTPAFHWRQRTIMGGGTVFRIADPEPVNTFPPGCTFSLLSDEGLLLAHDLRIMDMATSKEMVKPAPGLRGRAWGVKAIGFESSGNVVCTLRQNNVVSVLVVGKGEPRAFPIPQGQRLTEAVGLMPDGRVAALVENTAYAADTGPLTLLAWRIEPGSAMNRVVQIATLRRPLGFRSSDGGSRLIFAGNGKRFAVCDSNGGTIYGVTASDALCALGNLTALSPDGRRASTITAKEPPLLWDVPSKTRLPPLGSLRWQDVEVQEFFLSRDWTRAVALVTTGDGSYIRVTVFEPAAGEPQ